jgi:RNA polymerase sigma-70 factor (ECF subfamily)
METNKLNDLDFSEVYTSNYNMIRNHINFRLNNIEVSEDLTQDVFIKVLKHLKDYDPKESGLNTWLLTITNNSLIDYFRSGYNNNSNLNTKKISNFVDPESGRELLPIISDTDLNEYMSNKEIRNRIKAAIKNLSPKYRKIAMLVFLKGLKYDEVSELIDMPLNSIKVMVLRTREKLQLSLINTVRVVNADDPQKRKVIVLI